jgi:hypothetical protein
MLKQIVFLLIASILIVLFSAYGTLVLHWIGSLYQLIINLLSHVISNGSTGKIVRSVIALLAIPIIIGLAVNGIYLVIMRREFPYLTVSMWFIWLMLVVSAVLV